VPAVRTIVATGRPADIVLGLQRATNAVVTLAAPARSRLAAVTPGRLAVRVLRESTAPVLFYRPTL
jgi:nucleotide-binding universal stress UspA family protein